MASATTGQEQGEEAHEQFVDEEIGGPFVTSSPFKEFAHDVDGSVIPGAEREPYPTAGAFGGPSLPGFGEDGESLPPPQTNTELLEAQQALRPAPIDDTEAREQSTE